MLIQAGLKITIKTTTTTFIYLIELRPCSDLMPVPGHRARALKWTSLRLASARASACSHSCVVPNC